MTQDNGRQALGEIMAAVEHALGGAAPVAVATVVDAGELGIEVGAKMLVADFYKIPPLASLLVIVGLLGVAVVASLLHAARQPKTNNAAATASSRATTH